MSSNWQTFASTEQLDRALAQRIAAQLEGDITARGSASLAVSGGSTPKGFFEQLSQQDINWSSVFITLVDERWVDANNPDSNERLLRENLLQNRAKAANLLGLKTPGETGIAGLEEAKNRLAQLPRPLSSVVLGMGGDGHTASWFPQAENLPQLLDPDGECELALTQPVTAPHERITLTLPAVLNSREIIIHITGDEKRAVLDRAEHAGFPVATILTQTTTPVSIWWAPQ